eukprot:114981-Amphidinium_carterae.1
MCLDEYRCSHGSGSSSAVPFCRVFPAQPKQTPKHLVLMLLPHNTVMRRQLHTLADRREWSQNYASNKQQHRWAQQLASCAKPWPDHLVADATEYGDLDVSLLFHDPRGAKASTRHQIWLSYVPDSSSSVVATSTLLALA